MEREKAPFRKDFLADDGFKWQKRRDVKKATSACCWRKAVCSMGLSENEYHANNMKLFLLFFFKKQKKTKKNICILKCHSKKKLEAQI